MSRTQPKVILESVDKVTYKSDQIVEAAGIWAVFYDGQPIKVVYNVFDNVTEIEEIWHGDLYMNDLLSDSSLRWFENEVEERHWRGA